MNKYIFIELPYQGVDYAYHVYLVMEETPSYWVCRCIAHQKLFYSRLTKRYAKRKELYYRFQFSRSNFTPQTADEFYGQ